MSNLQKLVLIAGCSLSVLAAMSQARAATPEFHKLPDAAIQALSRQPGSGIPAPRRAAAPATAGEWSGSGNLGSIIQTNLYYFEYFTPPTSVPASGTMTTLSWNWAASNPGNYPLTVYLCIGSTSECLDVSLKQNGQVNLEGDGFPANDQVFYVAVSLASSTYVLAHPIVVGDESVIVEYSD